MITEFKRKNKGDKIWWAKQGEMVSGVFIPDDGVLLFSFDKQKVFNLFRDYPTALTPEEKEIFDQENPYWAEQLDF